MKSEYHEEATNANVKLFTDNAICGATLFGGLIGGAILTAINYYRLNRPKQAANVVVLSVLTVGLLFWIISQYPESFFDKIPDAAYHFLFISIAYIYIKNYQSELIENHFKSGGKKGSFSQIVVSTILGALIMVIILFPISYYAPAFPGEKVKMENTAGVVYYDGISTRENAYLLGKHLEAIEYFYGTDKRAAYINGSNISYNIILEIDKAYWENRFLPIQLESLKKELEEELLVSINIILRSYHFFGHDEIRVSEL